MLICHREEIQASEMQDNTAAALSPSCTILLALFSDKCAHAAGSLAFLLSRREINTTSKSAAAAPRGKRWAERMCHLHRKGCVFHSRDLSVPEQRLILPLCNGKDSALTSHGAELCWRHEMLKGENKNISGGKTTTTTTQFWVWRNTARRRVFKKIK